MSVCIYIDTLRIVFWYIHIVMHAEGKIVYNDNRKVYNSSIFASKLHAGIQIINNSTG